MQQEQNYMAGIYLRLSVNVNEKVSRALVNF